MIWILQIIELIVCIPIIGDEVTMLKRATKDESAKQIGFDINNA